MSCRGDSTNLSTRRARRVSAAALVAYAVTSPPNDARAQSSLDMVEHILGTSNVNAITGHGRLTVGVSRDGDLSVLSWPNPSYCDQLGYISSNALDARSQPRFGAPEGAGVFLGLIVEQATERQLTWLRDRSRWSIEQSYGPTDGPNVHTAYQSTELGLRVTVVDAVKPQAADARGDVMVRQVLVERSPSSAVDQAWLLTYANLSPLPPNSRVAMLPVVDWAKDGRNDFAALWDPSAQVVIHFHPEDQRVFTGLLTLLGDPDVDWGPAGSLLGQPSVTEAALQELADDLDSHYQPGAYLALTTAPAPDQHQVGYDRTPWCEHIDGIVDNVTALPDTFPEFDIPFSTEVIDGLRCSSTQRIDEVEAWQHAAEDAFLDAADGELSGSDIAAGEVNEALRTPLSFDESGRAGASVVLAAGADATSARTAALEARGDPDAVVDGAERELTRWLAERRLPEQTSPEVLTVARRSLVNLRTGTDQATGAVVASITRQPPYGLDWPRDGAFFNAAFDLSGQYALTEQRTLLYADWQRAEPVPLTPLIDSEGPVDPDTGDDTSYPAGAWEMNYYADGMNGGTIRFEIDNAGFSLWTMVAHVGWVEDTTPQQYLEERWEEISRAADLLARWRDPVTGLQAPAQEDDNALYTQTLHGAVTTFGALDMAARAARYIGRDAQAERWEARATELHQAIMTHLYDDEAGLFVSDPGVNFNPGSTSTGPTAWAVWPMHLLAWSDPRVQTQLEHDLELSMPIIDLETEGGSYVMKTTLSLALAWERSPEHQATLESLLEKLAAQATPDTHQFGEVMVTVEDGGERRADQRVSTPHLWEGTLFYLTAMAAEDPAGFLRYDAVLPPSRVGQAPSDEGCGCRLASTPDPPTGSGWILASALGTWWWRRRRRSATSIVASALPVSGR
ncbi:MAG: hypothetical protein JRI23_04805 [Deltaproteobacteria bacterium]|jgi:MYXO-CTERM domain-containing protein|nr:hypothetical protein [Deltaproteobacteria bacterium]MBW2530869.1 hypothetical protein [Deltaproteobacteria bacterium]